MWHEARKSERQLHGLMDAAKKRAERRAEFLAKRRGDPQQTLRVVGTRARFHHNLEAYQAAEQQQGLIPWNGQADTLIDRFDGRALLDFIREYNSSRAPLREKTDEELELEELCQFERFRDLIKQRRRGLTDEEGLDDIEQELEARATARPAEQQGAANVAPAGPQVGSGAYAKVGFAYEDGNETEDSEDEEEEEEEMESSEDSEDDEIEKIGREFGIDSFNRLVYLDRKAKEEERERKEAAKGDPALRKLTRKERRKLAQQEKERERDFTRFGGRGPLERERRGSPTYEAYPRPRWGRSRSHSRSPSRSRSPASRRRERDRRGGRDDRYRGDRDHRGDRNNRDRDRDRHRDRGRERDRPSAPKIEFITEFNVADNAAGGGAGGSPPHQQSIAPPLSPPRAFPDASTRDRPLPALGPSPILEALRSDPAQTGAVPLPEGFDKDRRPQDVKPVSRDGTSSALAKLKSAAAGSKGQPAEKKETPQERLKRIMSKQLTKQIRKDTAAETAKKMEQERVRLEKIAETRRIARRRSRSRSPIRERFRWSRDRSRGPSRSRSPPRRRMSRSPSRSHNPRVGSSHRRDVSRSLSPVSRRGSRRSPS